MLLHPPATAGRAITATIPADATARSRRSRRENVKNLSLAWVFQTDQTRVHQIFAAAGRWHSVLYRSRTMFGPSTRGPATRSGTTLIPRSKGEHIGHRGVAMYKG